jgi:hypothetical protein
MQHWLRVALLKRTFSGHSDNVLRAIRQVIQEQHDTFPMEPIFDKLKATPKSMRFDEDELDGLLSYKYGQSYAFTVLALLYPWLKYDQRFHVDHIFPRAMFNKRELERRGIPPEQWHHWLDHVNDLANLQLLQGLVNQVKADQEFEAWLRGECPAPQELAAYRERHLIPDVDLSFENFSQFLEAREKLMRERLADLLGVRLGLER